MSTALLHRVLGTEGENSQVLKGQQQLDKSQVQLLSKDLTNLIALVLDARTVDTNTALVRKTYNFNLMATKGDKARIPNSINQ